MADIRTVAALVTQGAQQFIKDYASAQQAVQALNTTLQQSERIRTPQLAPQMQAISAAFEKSRASAKDYVQTLQQLQGITQQVTTVSNEKTNAIDKQAHAEVKAKTSGISYLSTLSAIHAASFLASGSTFTLLGSFTTLGLAFSKLGPGAIGVGLALGGILGIFGAVSNAAQLLQQVLISVVQTLATVTVAASAAVTVAGVAGVKIAADVETQLAGLRAFGGATAEQLREASAQSSELAIRFGVAAKDVLEGASLFARAGGTVKEAIDGATEAIVALTVASQGEIAAAQAAIAVSQGIKAFNLEGNEAIRVANVLAGAAQASALSFTGVTQAFIQAAPGARTLGITIEDLGATMALLGNELVKGTITGTAFKQFLLDLIAPSSKAANELAKYGVSVKTADGQIRPLIDILRDLNSALGDQAVESGKVTAAARAQALAIIFESRAALAANILTREGAAGLEEFRDALEKVTATNITSVLLLPLNKQLEILKTVVEEVGRAFGESLLSPIRAATVGAIEFFKQVIPLARLAGEAVQVLATGQGFEALQTKITDLVGNNQLSSFLIELVNTFRNVADVILNTIVPAIGDFATRLGLVGSESGRIDQIGTAFEGINKTIQTTGRVIAAVIGAFAELAVQMIHNEGRGAELRDTLGGLVSKVLAGFLATTLALVPALAAAAAAMPIFARASILVAQIALRLIDVFKQLELKFIDIAELAARVGFITAVKEGDTPEDVKRVTEQYQRLGEAAQEMRKKTADALDVKGLSAQLDAFGGTVEGLETVISNFARGTTQESAAALTAAESNAAALRLTASEAIQAFDELGTESSHTQAQAAIEASRVADVALERAKVNARGFVGVFDNAAGDIQDAFANIIASVETSFSSIRDARGGTTGDNSVVDTKAIETAVNRVSELARDLGRKLSNLAEDTSTKTQNIIDKGLERIEDIFEKAGEQLRDLGKQAQEQIDEIFSNIGQRRDDRARTDALKDELDDQLRNKQQELDSEERAEERALDRTRQLRQRDTEDNQRILDEQFSDLERVLSRSQDATERAYRLIQRGREDALKQSQDAEERGLRRSLDAAATARKEGQQLRNAKTPEERARVQQQIAESRSEAAFSAQQETQLLALRQRHEKQQRAASDQAETQSVTFRRGLEEQMLAFRKGNEATLRTVRRNIEDGERTQRETEEGKQLQRRMDREVRLREFREGQERALRTLQDTLENEAAQRQATKIVDKAIEQAQKIIANAVRQALEQETAIEQQLEQQRQELDRTLRQQGQSIVDFEENLSDDVKAALQPQLNALKTTLEREGQNLRDVATAQREAALSSIGTAIGMGQIDLESLRPNLTIPSTPVQVTPSQVINASVIQAAQLIIGQAAASQLSQAMLGGLRQAGLEGVFDNAVDLNPVAGAINTGNNILEIIRRGLGR